MYGWYWYYLQDISRPAAVLRIFASPMGIGPCTLFRRDIINVMDIDKLHYDGHLLRRRLRKRWNEGRDFRSLYSLSTICLIVQ